MGNYEQQKEKLFSNHSAVKREQIIFILKLHNADQSQEWASRLLTTADSAGLQNRSSTESNKHLHNNHQSKELNYNLINLIHLQYLRIGNHEFWLH